MVKAITSEAEWAELMEQSKEKLVVVDFHASWCGPCKMIAPHVEAMSKEFSDVVFVKVDVDDQEEIAQKAGVTAMPTFQFFKGGSKVDQMTGANVAGLKDKIASNAQ